MAWQIKFTETAEKQLSKLDKPIAKNILLWLESRIISDTNPRLWGTTLSGDKSGKWRYRIGDYRIVCEINDNILLVRVIKVAHCREVYRN